MDEAVVNDSTPTHRSLGLQVPTPRPYYHTPSHTAGSMTPGSR